MLNLPCSLLPIVDILFLLGLSGLMLVTVFCTDESRGWGFKTNIGALGVVVLGCHSCREANRFLGR